MKKTLLLVIVIILFSGLAYAKIGVLASEIYIDGFIYSTENIFQINKKLTALELQGFVVNTAQDGFDASYTYIEKDFKNGQTIWAEINIYQYDRGLFYFYIELHGSAAFDINYALSVQQVVGIISTIGVLID